MRSDLTCPVEVVRVEISEEIRDSGKSQVVCLIDFRCLEEKKVDSVQMNIVCFDSEGRRLGGRLVRAHAHDYNKSGFSGAFRPEHVNGTTRVEASVEKVWYQDGMVWRREERNVREYVPNNLPIGRELDRLRMVAGPDAVGYPAEEDTVWICVCGRANRTSDEKCRRCKRDRKVVFEAFSRQKIEETVGEKERALEARTRENISRSTEHNVQIMEAEDRRKKRQSRRMRTVLTVLILVAAGLAAWRWLVPMAADRIALSQFEDGKAVEAKQIYEWIERFWPGEYGAGERALETEQVIIRRLIGENQEDLLREAVTRAEGIGDEALTVEGQLALAQLLIDQERTDEAEELLGTMTGSAAARVMLNELSYSLAAKAKERLDFETAIARFESLGSYEDSAEQRIDTIYLFARSLMRAGRLEEACAQFLRVAGYLDSMELLRGCRYTLAGQKRESGDAAEAAELYESLGIYQDAERLGKICRYEAGQAAQEQGNLTLAAEQFKMAGNYEDASERFAEVATALGKDALQAENYENAIFWLEQLPLRGEIQELYNEAVYAYAKELENAGNRAEAVVMYGSLGSYLDAQDQAQSLEYALALECMDSAPEEALDRFQNLGDYKDSQTLAERCLEKLAERAYSSGQYEEAISYYGQMKSSAEIERQIVRCRYGLAGQLAEQGEYLSAARLYTACGSYQDAEVRRMEMYYQEAKRMEDAGMYEQAANAFRALGSYSDSAACTVRCEDAWLQDVYRNAKLDMENGNYVGVLEALEPYRIANLPDRYKDIPSLFEEACLARALELIDTGRPLDALPYLELIPNNKTAKKRLGDYVYQVIGRWKDKKGTEYTFRRDGTCTIAGVNGYYGGSGYELRVGPEPYPTQRAYLVVNLRSGVLTLKDYAADANVRLTYLGEALPIVEVSTDAEDGEGLTDESSQDGISSEGDLVSLVYPNDLSERIA